MKLVFKNTGEHPVKIMTKGHESGTAEGGDFDNGIVETIVEVGAEVEIDFAGKLHAVDLREMIPWLPRACLPTRPTSPNNLLLRLVR